MKFRISSLLYLSVIAGLVTALVIALQNREIPTVKLSIDSVDLWEFDRSLLVNSKWTDKSQAPPLSLSQAYQRANEIADELSVELGTSNADSTNSRPSNWYVTKISLQYLDLIDETHAWVYVVNIKSATCKNWSPIRGGLVTVKHHWFVMLMDGTVLFHKPGFQDEASPETIDFDELVDHIPEPGKSKVGNDQVTGGTGVDPFGSDNSDSKDPFETSDPCSNDK